MMTSSFDWFTVLSVCFVIGWSDYFGFGFTTLIENCSIRVTGCLVTTGNLFELFFWVVKDNVILAQNVSAEEIILPCLPLEDNRRIIKMIDLRVLYFIKIN